ncbi:MAG: DUF4315 family protein [Clostridia bacterium]|uniref:DUF4315 family protein n=1 Tax=Hespellia stercorisuis DSM 15480 TaxID=1121950 RepID=A0A1M6QTY7_9FIRM|nr:DUF4315 family protein [Hespellia stercorisuis]MDD3186079.1 DUF4315 family protein [Anaerostipes sp.]NCC01684.1 DUF4315 family protein [Clostridia bacterium]NCD03766.1 DUF4315 family protein [Clostridia bacterium]SHK23573.1 protein of unknown function [Hespellia stercorisuis DSM 15480]
MNKKLKRYLDEIDKTNGKIAELQEYLKSVQIALKKEEDGEIIRSIRSMKLEPKALFDLLNGLQDGSLTIQQVQESMIKSASSTQKELPQEAEKELEDIDDEEKEIR